MQTIKKKVKLIYLPFLGMTVAFILVYTFLNWLLVVRPDIITKRPDLVNLWLPLGLPWIPILIWLRPRIRLLKLKGANGHLPFLYLFIAALAMGIPTVIAQTYIKKASGTLTKLETINEIDKSEQTKFYTLKERYLDKTNIGVHPFVYYTKNMKYLNMHIYYVMPIFEREADTAKSSCLAWVGIKYSQRIRNAYNIPEKKKMYYDFAIESQKDFDSKDFNSFGYLERMGKTEDTLGYKEAIKKSIKVSSKETPVFRTINQPFESRTGNTLAWTIAAFAIAAVVWFIMLVFPKFAGNFPDAESYVVDQPESAVLQAIKTFKMANPHHLRPQYLDLNDGRNIKDQFDHWYHLYFFYPEDYQIVYAWTRPIDNNSTEIALVAINEGLVLGNWKDINRDFIGQDNDIQKEKFTNKILNKITMHVEHNMNAG